MTTIFTLKGANFTAPGLPILRTVQEQLLGISSLKAWHLPSASRASNDGTTYKQAALNPGGLPLYVETASAPTLITQTVKGAQVPVLDMTGFRLLWDGVIHGAGLEFSVVAAMKLTRAMIANNYLWRSLEDGFANNLSVTTSNGTTIRGGIGGKFVAGDPIPVPAVGEWFIAKFGRTAAGTYWIEMGGITSQVADTDASACPQGLIVGGRYMSTNSSTTDMILGEQLIFNKDLRTMPEAAALDNYLSKKWVG